MSSVTHITDDCGFTMPTIAYKGTNYPATLFCGDAEKHFKTMQEYPLGSEDVIVCSYPKSGTHWVYQIASMLQSKTLDKVPKLTFLDVAPASQVVNMTTPRVLATHFKYQELPESFRKYKGKILWVCRDPKDALVSHYYFMRDMAFIGYKGEWDSFVNLYYDDQIFYSNWVQYVRAWNKIYEADDTCPILPVYYEDLKKDCSAVVRKIADFLEVDVKDQFLDEIVEYTNFKSMSTLQFQYGENIKATMREDGTSYVLRKGEVGDWKNYFTMDQLERMDNHLKGLGKSTLGSRYVPDGED